MYVFLVSAVWSIFQEMSVVSWVSGSIVPPINTQWLPGDWAFRLIMSIAGILFGLTFLFFVNPVPAVITKVVDVIPGTEAEEKKHLITKFTARFGRNRWVAWFIWMFAAPLAIIIGGAFLLNVNTHTSHNALFRIDFLIFFVYQMVIIAIVYAVKASHNEVMHLANNLFTLEGSKAFEYSSAMRDEKKLTGTEMLMAQYQITRRRVAVEFYHMLAVSGGMFMLMVFMFLPTFYLQGLIAMGAGILILLVLRTIFGVERVQYGYESIKPELYDYSATKKNVVIGFGGGPKAN
jgi:hypothetical protein